MIQNAYHSRYTNLEEHLRVCLSGNQVEQEGCRSFSSVLNRAMVDLVGPKHVFKKTLHHCLLSDPVTLETIGT